MALDQLPRRALGDDAASVHDHQPVAELLRLVHVVGGEDEGHTLPLERVEAIPQQVASLRVEAGGGLVEQQQLGLVDEGARHDEPPLHAARQRVDAVVATVAQLHERQQLVGALTNDRAGEVEVSPVDEEVVPNGQLGVEVVLLGRDTDARADAGTVDRGVHPEHAQLAAGDGRYTPDHAHGGALARPVRPEEAERLARLDVELDAVDRHERPEALREAVALDERRHTHARRRYRFATCISRRISSASPCRRSALRPR